jgi:predicted DNA-binding ribbon-helix-helix protein
VIHLEAQMASSLLSRNVTVAGHRTSVRLEAEMWDALSDICRREGMSAHEICTAIDARRSASTLTAALRVFVMDYFRAASTEEGHARAGHGVGALRGAEPYALRPAAAPEQPALNPQVEPAPLRVAS